jgi:hypothetical protein
MEVKIKVVHIEISLDAVKWVYLARVGTDGGLLRARTVMDLRVPWKFLDCYNISFRKKVLLRGVS